MNPTTDGFTCTKHVFMDARMYKYIYLPVLFYSFGAHGYTQPPYTRPRAKVGWSGSTYRRNPGRRAFSAFLSAVTRQPGLVTTGTDHCPGDRRPANSRRHQPSSLPNSIPYRLHHTAPNHDDGPSLPCFLSLSCLTLFICSSANSLTSPSTPCSVRSLRKSVTIDSIAPCPSC